MASSKPFIFSWQSKQSSRSLSIMFINNNMTMGSVLNLVPLKISSLCHHLGLLYSGSKICFKESQLIFVKQIKLSCKIACVCLCLATESSGSSSHCLSGSGSSGSDSGCVSSHLPEALSEEPSSPCDSSCFTSEHKSSFNSQYISAVSVCVCVGSSHIPFKTWHEVQSFQAL